ncbi:hypothetical protein KDK95_14530 [Actinospica sp. MGRD01-02]|uniref:WXG100 family type VII secretion target n=1 Tax=Actinospica acidithermotolerans TaxID=2828514 RepID=A0A941ILD5_9ACTN|nr:hypothetical protein [Actinospica acidithermotolerans]MBR7827531.1 hypothetical protein [Actinospica acidithermotolerans]
MTHSGFQVAPADFAAAAPRFEHAADDLSAAVVRTVDVLEGHGSFWGQDEEFEHEYRADWSAAVDLATACEKGLRAVSDQLANTSVLYVQADDASAQSFGTLHDRLAAILDPNGVRR